MYMRRFMFFRLEEHLYDDSIESGNLWHVLYDFCRKYTLKIWSRQTFSMKYRILLEKCDVIALSVSGSCQILPDN